MIDNVTGLLDSKEFNERAEEILNNAADSEKFAFVSMDFKNFNYINNVYGYAMGDRILKATADEFIAAEGFVCGSRLYSDHFVVIFKYNDADAWLDGLMQRYAVFRQKYQGRLSSVFFSASFGVYYWEKGVTVNKSIDRAGVARKSIKDKYRSFFSVYSDEHETRYNKVAEVVSIFRKALASDNIVIVLQPKISLETGEVIGAEALARIRNEDGSLCVPMSFVPTLEDIGYVTTLDNRVLQKVLELIRSWMDQGIEPIPISVNWSYMHFIHDTLADDIAKLVKSYGVDPKYIEFEIVERVFLEDAEKVYRILAKFREYGFKVSLDDFGSGYSSLGIMGNIPVDVIKLDKVLLDTCDYNDRGVDVIKGIIDIVKKINLEVLCEGVERADQANMLKDFGCLNVQGYLYDKPLMVSDFEKKYVGK
ncbi:MAG: EAL domain-containing protein [Lachnospiraceae bacterium]|nr:EAL domain-containing protein [Lachnospiraceae bacterium]